MFEPLDVPQTESERLYELQSAATEEFTWECDEPARKLASQLAREATSPGHGAALHTAHTLLGLLHLRSRKDVHSAKTHLLASTGPRHPTLSSFGPFMCLADALLRHDESATVILYLEACRSLWKSGQSKLDRWVKEIRAGQIPEFGFNGRLPSSRRDRWELRHANERIGRLSLTNRRGRWFCCEFEPFPAHPNVRHLMSHDFRDSEFAQSSAAEEAYSALASEPFALVPCSGETIEDFLIWTGDAEAAFAL